MHASIAEPETSVPGRPKVLVTGGTGTLGRHVVARLQDAGCNVRVLSRRAHEATDGVAYVTGDLLKDEGVDAAVDGAPIIVHCAGNRTGDDEATRNLVRAASRYGAQHIVYVSVVGADRIPAGSGVDRTMFGYFGSKLAAERVVAHSRIPWTIVRSAQFQESLLKVVQRMTKLPVIPVPAGFRFQPVDAGEVAARIVDLALGAPVGLAPDVAGPRVYSMVDLLKGYVRARGTRRLIVPVWRPGKAARAFRAGANLTRQAAVSHRTWEDCLAERVVSEAGRAGRSPGRSPEAGIR